MVDAFTSTDPTTLGTSLVQTAYDRYVEFALRAMPLWRDLADKRPVQQAMPGDSVVFQLYNDLAPQTATLTEIVDPDAVAIPSTTSVTVTLNEYGNAQLTTRKLELFALSDVDPAIADLIAFNMRDSIDNLVRDVIRGGTHGIWENGGSVLSDLTSAGAGTTVGVTATDVLKSRDIRLGVTKLRGLKAMPKRGELFYIAVHPDQALDLRSEVGNAAWRPPHEYQSNTNIWAGETGVYEGAFFVETPRVFHTNDGAGVAPDEAEVYRAVMCGRQALAEAASEEPHVVIGPVVDKLMRFRPLGWYGVLGHAIYRQDSLIRIETSSSVA